MLFLLGLCLLVPNDVFVATATSSRCQYECENFTDIFHTDKIDHGFLEQVNRTFNVFNETGKFRYDTHREISSLDNGTKMTNVNEDRVRINGILSNWFTQVWEAADSFPNNLSAACRRDVGIYLQELQNVTEWAVRMMDASGKFPPGILMGNIRTLGDFDECLSVVAPMEIEPQYCMAVIALNTELIRDRYPKWFELLRIATYDRLNKEIEDLVVGTFPAPKGSRVEWAVCVPASCSHKDVQDILNIAATRILPGIDTSVQVTADNCYRNEPGEQFTRKDYFILTVLGLIFCLVVIGTLIDNVTHEEDDAASLLLTILRAFSLNRSWNQLTDLANSEKDQIGCIDGLRSISAIWIILGHQGVIAGTLPYANKISYFDTHKNLLVLPIWNFCLAVDTFLIIAGLVRCYSLLPSLEKRKVNHAKKFFQRYLRLSPALLAVVGFYITILHRISTGPYWKQHVGSNSYACANNWWKTIFYINNYDKDEHYRCILQTWYTSMDMQLFFISPLLIVPLWRRPKFGLTFLGILIAVSTGIQALTLWALDLPGLPVSFQRNDEALADHLSMYYDHSHVRIVPYLIGILTGYFMYCHKSIAMSKTQLITGWCLALLALLYPIVGSYDIIGNHIIYNPWNQILFGTIHKSIWALGIAWVIFVCYYGYAEILNGILSSRAFKLLSRLSYSIFVSHFAILIAFAGHSRAPKNMNFPTMIKDTCGDLFLVMLVATGLYLVIEAPFEKLSKMLFEQKRARTKKTE